MKDELEQRLAPTGQEHLLRFWDQLEATQRQELGRQICDLDFSLVERLFRERGPEQFWDERAEPPPAIRLHDSSPRFAEAEARLCGEKALRQGQVGMILVAGGQGTRLGFAHPKGLFPLGPVSQRTLLQIMIERLMAVGQKFQVDIPLYLMTSPATHQETLDFLQQQHWFGLSADQAHVFCQASMPALEATSGKVLMADKGTLFTGPDGHGGMLAALAESGGLEHARDRGIEHFFYGQIDNPLLQLCDSALTGYHLLADSELTTQVVEKAFPLEPVGNVVSIDGRLRIVEYIDLPDEQAQRLNPDGSLRYWAGSIAVHLFGRSFLERMLDDPSALPFHVAKKKVSHVDNTGKPVEPKAPNAFKFERFIFDLLPFARNAIVVEGDKAECFAPVKNADDAAHDTPRAAREAMIHQHTQWLIEAGVEVDDGVAVEISPFFALDAQEVSGRIQEELRVAEPTFFQ